MAFLPWRVRSPCSWMRPTGEGPRRAGNGRFWLDAFEWMTPREFRFATGLKPSVQDELVAFQARPEFRVVVEIVGSPSVMCPRRRCRRWRLLPVYRWNVGNPSGWSSGCMGSQKPPDSITRSGGWMKRAGPHLSGSRQRFDAGSGDWMRRRSWDPVPDRNQGQLITRNPQNGALWVEIRSRNLNLGPRAEMGRPPSFLPPDGVPMRTRARRDPNRRRGGGSSALFSRDWGGLVDRVDCPRFVPVWIFITG